MKGPQDGLRKCPFKEFFFPLFALLLDFAYNLIYSININIYE